LRRVAQDGVTFFEAEYSANDRLVRLKDPSGETYTFSYETDGRAAVILRLRRPTGAADLRVPSLRMKFTGNSS